MSDKDDTTRLLDIQESIVLYLPPKIGPQVKVDFEV
jgi:hypothetical protein